MDMLEDEKRAETENTCPGSGFPLAECDCFDCKPHYFELNQMLVECRNIEELKDRLEQALDFVTYLDENSFEISGVSEDSSGRLIPGFIEDRYWLKCEGCGYPVSLPLGTSPKGLCGECYEKETSHEGLAPIYYDNLFEHVMEVCEMREGTPRIQI
jgi:hypothetical protein